VIGRGGTGLVALGPMRAATASLQRVLAQPELAGDLIVIVGDANRGREKRDAYRAIFSTLGRVHRPALWVPGPADGGLEREVRSAYGPSARLSAGQRPARHSTRSVLLTSQGAAPPDLDLRAAAMLGELMRTYEPRLAPRAERPAIYSLSERGRSAWLEL
jgi:hypothetical protein